MIFLPEWAPQCAVQLTWPHADTDWAYMLEEVTETYINIAREIAERIPLIVVTPEPDSVQELLQNKLSAEAFGNVRLVECPTDDTWARDHAFLSVVRGGKMQLLDFRFNGWGGKFSAERDNAINRSLYATGLLRGEYQDSLDFELEGGSVESDGRGTILTTTECVLNPNRNGAMTQADREAVLRERLGANRILWLHHGALQGDDTDSHIDTLARLCPNDTIVYVRCDDKTDSHYADLALMEAEIKALRTTDGKPYRLVSVPLPDAITDDEGARLPATYANYLVLVPQEGKPAVLVPTYAQPAKDAEALAAISRAFNTAPGETLTYDIVGIDCRSLICQHGSLHCATMQYPLCP